MHDYLHDDSPAAGPKLPPYADRLWMAARAMLGLFLDWLGVGMLGLALFGAGVVLWTPGSASSTSITSSPTRWTSSRRRAGREDGAHASGESGYLVLAVRNDTPTALANTTLDRIPLTWLIPRPHVV